MNTLDEIKQMMANGDTAQADEALKKLLAKAPENLQAKMLYGTCRQLLGDEETFKRIHDELAPEMLEQKTEVQSEVDSQWMMYHRTFMELAQNPFVVESDKNDTEAVMGEVLYGCPPYLNEVESLQKALQEERLRKFAVLALLILTPILFWLAWWLGQRI